jgi:hypothetical protein
MMHLKRIFGLAALVTVSAQAFAGNHDPAAIIALMPGAKISLLEGIERAEAASGVAVSAKFEVGDDGKLALSVYTVPEGLNVEPEAATLSELSYDPTVENSQPGVEVFADKEHLARSAAHMTIFRISRLSLSGAIQKAVWLSGGTPIDVRNPSVVQKRPVASVILFDAQRGAYTVNVDLLSGLAKFVDESSLASRVTSTRNAVKAD